MSTAKKLVVLGVIASMGFGFSGCSQTTGPNESGGTIIGALAGGLIGSRFGAGGGKVAAVIAGTMIGGFLGNQVGKGMDEQARQQAYHAQYNAIASGQASNWRASSGPSGYVEPGPVYSESGRVCRQYTHTIIIDGRQERGVGTACRAPDGRWDIIS